MRRYAEQSGVPIDRSRAEIESTLRRYGATAFAYGWKSHQALIQFEIMGRAIRFRLDAAQPNDKLVRFTPTGRRRSDSDSEVEATKETRRRWRALCLILKAKLEAVHSGVLTLEEEFLPYMQLQDGRTVADWAVTELRPALEAGRMPLALLGDGQ